MKHLIAIALLAYWPLFKNNGITGTFGEYRFNHIHSGFDLSTEGKTGLPVKCFDDGFVYMIKVKKRGYGNVVYVKHPGKKLISVYGHLKKFNKKIQKIADDYKKKRKTKYPGAIILQKKIKVKKGEIIGYSGESGAGLPHLHFELRDYANNPVDASKYGFDMRFDTSYPCIVSLKVIPQDVFSRFNGKFREGYVKAVKKDKNRFFLPDFSVSGNVLFALNVYDKAGRSKVSVKSIKFYLNGKQVFSYFPEKFSFNTFKQSCCVYDFEDTSLSPTVYFYNLFEIDGCGLSVLNGSDYYPFKKGINEMKIVVCDFHENCSILEGSFRYEKAPTIPADFSPLAALNGKKVVFAENWDGIVLFGNYAIFPYGREESEYKFGKLTVRVKGINGEKRLVRVWKEKTFKGFLIPVEESFFRFDRENEFIKKVRYSISLEKFDRTYGIYFFNKFTRKWFFIGDEFDKNKKTISADYYRLGKIGVFIDKVPPEIKGNPFYFDGKLVIKVKDRGKGVNDETAYLKGKTKTFSLEYDNDRKWLFYDGKIPAGEYVLSVEDFAGNKTVKKVRVK